MARRPLPEGQARTVRLAGVRIKPAAAHAFRSVCTHLGLTEADAQRQALEDWISKHLKNGATH